LRDRHPTLQQSACHEDLHPVHRNPVARVAAVVRLDDPPGFVDQEIRRHQVVRIQPAQSHHAQAAQQRRSW